MGIGDVTTTDSPKRPSRLFGRYIIKHRFQFKFAITIFIFLACATFIIWLFGNMAVNRMVSAEMVTDVQAVEHLHTLMSTIGQLAILALAVVFALSLIFSHFVAGPIYRFEKTLEAMRDGDLTILVRLRPRDEFKEIANLFNQTLASLRNRLQKERKSVEIGLDKVGELVEKLRQAGRAAEATELEHLILDIKNTPPQLKI